MKKRTYMNRPFKSVLWFIGGLAMAFISLIGLPAFRNAASENTVQQVAQPVLSKLVGTWVNTSRKQPVFEHWEWTSPESLRGISYKLQGIDTLLLESIKLEKTDQSSFAYIPIAFGQNDNKAVTFVATHFTPDSLIFENPSHDFPHKIAYYFIGKDSLYAEISGPMNGLTRKLGFPFKRL